VTRIKNDKEFPYRSVNNTIKWKYIELRETFHKILLEKQLAAAIIFLLIYRILFYFNNDPIVRFMKNVVIDSLKKLTNIVIIISVFIFLFALLLHINAGTDSDDYSNVFLSFILVLKFLTGHLKTDYIKGIFNSINSYVYIILLIIIKSILFTFIFPVVKQAYEEQKKGYEEFIKLPHVKLTKGSLRSFFLFWQLANDFFKSKLDFKDIDAKKFVTSFVSEEEEEDKITYHKIRFEKITIFLLHKGKSLM